MSAIYEQLTNTPLAVINCYQLTARGVASWVPTPSLLQCQLPWSCTDQVQKATATVSWWLRWPCVAPETLFCCGLPLHWLLQSFCLLCGDVPSDTEVSFREEYAMDAYSLHLDKLWISVLTAITCKIISLTRGADLIQENGARDLEGSSMLCQLINNSDKQSTSWGLSLKEGESVGPPALITSPIFLFATWFRRLVSSLYVLEHWRI